MRDHKSQLLPFSKMLKEKIELKENVEHWNNKFVVPLELRNRKQKLFLLFSTSDINLILLMRKEMAKTTDYVNRNSKAY
ncbi:CLUMA_CG005338, isoform A [Clunio marinus]|uniref:CLUMA_CG005338, isoform A n=1 Tax=Clunio marinus TaxID=568069 RepID=A0A1J1HUL5_9DIPT|nr:CLUMA_CG005338, isoform A [Clunio marinus]